MSLVGGCVCVCICGCTCMIMYACVHMYLSRGGITSFSQPGLTERISAQFIFSVHVRKQWIPQVCKVLIWDPLKFSHHYKFNSTLCTLHSWRKGNNFIILHTVPPEQEALTNQEAIPVFCTGVCRKMNALQENLSPRNCHCSCVCIFIKSNLF